MLLRLLPVALTIIGGLSSMCPLIDLVRRPLAETVIRLALAGNGNTLIIGAIGGTTMIASCSRRPASKLEQEAAGQAQLRRRLSGLGAEALPFRSSSDTELN